MAQLTVSLPETIIARVIHQEMVEVVAAEMVLLVHIILDHQVQHLQALVVVGGREGLTPKDTTVVLVSLLSDGDFNNGIFC